MATATPNHEAQALAATMLFSNKMSSLIQLSKMLWHNWHNKFLPT
jgi:hypothetical protein